MIPKRLHSEWYENYHIIIEGVYDSDYGIEYRNEWYYGAVNMNITIKNHLGENIFKSCWNDYSYWNEEENPQVARYRHITKNKWYNLYPIVVGLIHIKDDYNRILEELTKECKRKVRSLIVDKNVEMSNQKITDDLPDSLELL